MASKRRLRRKACDGKIRYPDLKTAEGAKFRMKNYTIHGYQCPHCHNFHLGHRPAKIIRAIAQSKRDKEI